VDHREREEPMRGLPRSEGKHEVTWLGTILAIVLLLVIVLVVGCGSSSPQASTTAASGEANQATKVIKIGAIDNLQATVGVDQKKNLDVVQDMYNKQGGITVNGEKYKLQIILYDDGGDASNGKTAVNRLIFEDKVNFIVGDLYTTDSLISVAEANKVILSGAPLSPAMYNPSNKYSFNTAALTATGPAALGWIAKQHPGATAVFAVPDDQQGHMAGALVEQSMAAFGLKGTSLYYPASTTDFSSIATKVKQSNPQLFATVAESVMLKNVYEAGWRGTMFAIAQISTGTLLSQVPADELTGYVGPSYYTEFDPGMTQLAKDFQAAYTEKYGKWDSPSVAGLSQVYAIIAAIQKADSVDVDKVADALATGLSWETPGAKYQMIARPDMGITRTVDSAISFPMKTIVDGKPQVVADITIEDAIGYAEQVNAATAAAGGGAPPAGGAPGGTPPSGGTPPAGAPTTAGQ
jgi:branched-chain amino acid transport system substrate-binding protein